MHMQKLKERTARFLAKTHFVFTGLPALGALSDKSPDIMTALDSLRGNSQRAKLGVKRSCEVARAVCRASDDITRSGTAVSSAWSSSAYGTPYQQLPTFQRYGTVDISDKGVLMNAIKAGSVPTPDEIIGAYQEILASGPQ